MADVGLKPVCDVCVRLKKTLGETLRRHDNTGAKPGQPLFLALPLGLRRTSPRGAVAESSRG